MTVHVNTFALDILKDVPGAPVELVERELRFTAIDFCKYTMTWRAALDDVAVVAGTNEYTLTVPTDSRLESVFYIGHDGIRVLPTSERTLDDNVDSWRTSATQRAEIAEWYFLPDRTKIRIALTPSQAGDLTVVAVLKPTVDAPTLPDFLYEDHLEALRSGAMGRLLALPKKDWSDPALAAYYQQMYDQFRRNEKAERWNDYTRQSSLSVQPHAYSTGAR